jgi:hypothetical protein
MNLNNTLMAAAVAGILAGATGCGGEATPEPEAPSGAAAPEAALEGEPAEDSVAAPAADEAAPDMAKHGCKGQNDCKGQGGCKTDKNACKGQNECKGQGGCKVE